MGRKSGGAPKAKRGVSRVKSQRTQTTGAVLRLGSLSISRTPGRIPHPAESGQDGASGATAGSRGVEGDDGGGDGGATGDALDAASSVGASPTPDAGPSRFTGLRTAAEQAKKDAAIAAEFADMSALAAAYDPTAENLEIAQEWAFKSQKAQALSQALDNSLHQTDVHRFQFPLRPAPLDRGQSKLSDREARAIFKEAKSWNALKAKYAGDPGTMAGLFAYRKKYVDGLIDEFRLLPGNETLIANASGSNDLTSDYDVTVTVVGDPQRSVDVIKLINQRMREDFGAESGTVFDTNLYYKAVTMKDNILKDSPLAGQLSGTVGTLEEPEATRPVTPSALAGYHRDQDVLALLKQRRYMSDDEWNAFRTNTLAMLGGESNLGTETAGRFTEAERLSADLQAQSAAKRESILSTMSESERAAIDEDDLTLRVNNLLYIDKLQRVAAAEGEEAALLDAAVDLDATRESRMAAWTALNEKRREIYRLKGESLYFAAEAYHSTGALVHIVEGIQGGGRINAPLELLVQSFNEQHGDFMKDAEHYDDDAEFFYRSAKYAGRMSVAMRDYFMKANGITPEKLAAMRERGVSLDDILTGTSHLGEDYRAALVDAGVLGSASDSLPFSFSADQKHSYQMLDAMTNNASKFLLAIRKGVSKDSGPDMQDWYTRLTPDQKKFWATRYVDMMAGASTKEELVQKLMALAESFNADARRFDDATYAARNGGAAMTDTAPRGYQRADAAAEQKKHPRPVEFLARARGK